MTVMSKTSLFGSMLMAFVIAIGISSAWEAVANWVMQLADDGSRRGSINESISLTDKGEPLIVRSSYTGSYRYTTDEVLTLDGEPRAVNPAELYGATSYLQGSDRWTPDYPPSWWERLAAINDGGVPETYWYLVHDGRVPGKAYGVGFHSKTKLLVGHFSRRGFSQAFPPQEDWFDLGTARLREATTANSNTQEPQWKSYEPYYVLLAGGKLWLIDLPRREVKALTDCPGAYAIGTISKVVERPAAAAGENPLQAVSTPEETSLVARNDDKLFVVDKKGGKPLTIPLPAKLSDAGLNTWQLANGQFLIHAWWVHYPPKPKRAPVLIWLDADGKVAKEQTLRMAEEVGYRSFPLPEVWRENIRDPVPLSKTLLWIWATYYEAKAAKPPSVAKGFATVFKRAWLASLVLYPLCIIPAWAAYRRQKRFGLPHAGAWAAFVYILGVPGWLAYRFHRAWPVKEECPNCRQPAPRDRDACTECGAVFPPPPLKGIEVFA